MNPVLLTPARREGTSLSVYQVLPVLPVFLLIFQALFSLSLSAILAIVMGIPLLSVD